MALARQLLTIPFGEGGLETKVDVNSVLPPKLLTLENAIFLKPKRLSKRNGYQSLGLNGPTVGQMIATYNSELLVADKSTLYSYNAANTSWTSKGNLISTNVTQTAIIRNGYQQTGQDSATNGGLTAYVWEDTQGGSRYCVVDTSTGQIVQPNTLIVSTAAKPKVFALGNFFVLLYFNSSDSLLYGATIAVTAPTAALSPLALTTAGGTSNSINTVSPNYDATVITTSSGPQFYIAFNTNQGGGGTTIFYYAASAPTSRVASVNVSGEASTVINIFADLARKGPVLAYWNSTSVKTRAYDYTLSTLFAADQIETIANVAFISGVSISSSTTTLKVFYSISAGSTYNYLTKVATITNNPGPPGQRIGQLLLPVIPYTSPGEFVSTSAAVYLRSASLVGKAFAYNGIAYVPLVYQSPLQPTYFVADQSGNIIAKVLYSLGGNIPTRASLGAAMLTEVNASATSYQIALLAKDLLTTQSGQVYTQTGVESVTLNFFDSQNSYLRASLGQNLHINGGCLQMYDGLAPVEHGFHLYPEPVTGAAQGSGGSLSAGSYQGIAVYAWIDNQGQTHRSAPSVAATVTAVGSDKIIWTVPTLRLTAKQSTRAAPTIELYRTQANGTVFYLDSSITSPTRNDTTADTVAINSTAADTAITGNPILYTTGSPGPVQNYAPNPCSALVVHRNRLWALDSTNPLQWWYSKQCLAPSTGVNTPPAEFSNQFVYNVDPRGGNVTAGASLDDKFIHFKATSIFATFGQGPDSTGGQNDFTDAQIVTTDAGCVNNRSIVIVPDGLMFQSQKGIYLLDRALRVSYIGAPVEAYNSQTVTGAALIPNTNQVRFTLSSGIALVYDYFMGQWSTFTNVNAVDSAVWQQTYVYLQPTGAAMQETPGVFSDNGSFIKMRVATPWLQFAEVNGFQRLRRAMILGEYASPHQLLVGVAYDFSPAITQSDTITPSTGAAYGVNTPYGDPTVDATYGGAFERYQWLVHLAKQKCTAVQFTIEDSNTGAVGEGFSLSALTFDMGVKRGLVKLPATRSVG